MRRALFIALVGCLVTIHQTRLINRCDLAKLLHQEEMDGFEGFSLSDCEYRFLITLISPFLLAVPYGAIFLSLYCL